LPLGQETGAFCEIAKRDRRADAAAKAVRISLLKCGSANQVREFQRLVREARSVGNGLNSTS
jgi:hypothetical protein